MSRIRSIHPGLFSDPEFVQVGMAARLALIGLWTEADDHGVFEWKPLALKMKIFPGDAVDMEALMTELTISERIKCVSFGGKSYGICRNFCKYQRPKSPSYRMPFSPEWAEFVGIKSAESDSPPPALPQETTSTPEKSPQMEDGEKDVEEKKEEGAQERSPARRGKRLSEEWVPSPEGAEFARSHHLSIETTLAKFRDHWLAEAGPKASKLDWDRAWKTWCRREVSFSRNKSSPPGARGSYSAPISSDDHRRLVGYAQMIKAKVSPGQNFTSADRFKLIKAGLITMEDCEKAGCAA